jgi:preprotein translocase subunit YajC
MTNLIPSALNLIAHSVAQPSDGPSLPGAAPAAPAAGTPGAAAPGASNAAPGGSSFMIMMIVLLGAMILFSFVSSRREKKKRDQLLGNIKKHDKVLTIGGVVGTVVEVKDAEIVLKVDETSNTRITFTKSAISQVIPQDAAA